jgi:hypothetical protein
MTKNLDCPICLDPFDIENGFVNTGCCKQEVCFQCFINWRANNDTCPVCRTDAPPLPFREKIELIRVPSVPPVAIPTETVRSHAKDAQRMAMYILVIITLLVALTTIVTSKCGVA